MLINLKDTLDLSDLTYRIVKYFIYGIAILVGTSLVNDKVPFSDLLSFIMVVIVIHATMDNILE